MDDLLYRELVTYITDGSTPNRLLGPEPRNTRRAFWDRATRYRVEENKLFLENRQVLSLSELHVVGMNLHVEKGHMVKTRLHKLLQQRGYEICGDEVDYLIRTCLGCSTGGMMLRVSSTETFRPLGLEGQRRLCKEHNLPIGAYAQSYNRVGERLGAPQEIYKIANDDFRCFARCVSVAVTGNQGASPKIHRLTLTSLDTNHTAIVTWLRYNSKNGDKMEECSRAFYEPENAGALLPYMLATAIVLKTDVYFFEDILNRARRNKRAWFRLPANVPDETPTPEGIYIEGKNKGHADLVLGVKF